jgi:vanillate O-demethylase monooxygenase subunit
MAFFEDVEVFSAQQRNLDLNPNPPQLDINADTGVIQARRIIDRLRGEEQAAMQMTAAE